MKRESLRFALVAGELSGDNLGAALIAALKTRFPDATFYGVAGPRMIEAGCEPVAHIDMLSVMGIAEVIPALPRLFRLRAQLLERFTRDRPDVVIGIDAPDFNLGLERRLRERGQRTVHVVSPTVWAWRQGRVKNIARSVDLLLCLFPFEPRFYAEHSSLKTAYIGHPLAESLDASVGTGEARRALGLRENGPVLAVLPGSRGGELKYLAEPFVRAAALLHKRLPGLRFVTPIAKPSLRAGMQAAIAAHGAHLDWTLVSGQSREAMRVGDAVLVASGTAALECLLVDRPMVVAYRGSALSAWLLVKAGLLKTKYVSLPNLLAAEPVVPELLQEAATPEGLANALEPLLTEAGARQRQLGAFAAVRAELKRDAAAQAADAIAQLLREPVGAS